MATTQRRAKAGGEYGANGDFYTGGSFIATTDRPKGKAQHRTGTGKQEIEPYVWAVPPQENLRSIYRLMAGIVMDGQYYYQTKKMRMFQSEEDRLCSIIQYYFNDDVESGKREIQEMMDRFNAGERWYEWHPD